MALGTELQAGNRKIGTGIASNLLPHIGQWMSAVDTGGANVADNGGSRIVDPDAQITAATKKIVNISGAGTLMIVRLRYFSGDTPSTSPVIQVFGRASSTEAWMALRNKANSSEITLTAAVSTDVQTTISAIEYCVTEIDLDDHYLDTAGCSQVLVGIKTAYSATGSPSIALVEAKFI